MSTFLQGAVVSHNGGLWFASSDTSGEPGVDSAWQLMVQGATPATDLPATATTGQVLTWNGTAWDAETLPASTTGGATTLSQLTDVDESTAPTAGQILTWNGTKWSPAALPADNDPSPLPTTATTGQVLTWNGTAWDAETPAASTGGGGGTGGSLSAGTTTTAIPTTSTAGWVQAASYGTLSSDGTELKLTSSTAGQFVRYYQDTTRAPKPVGLAPTVLQFDIKIDSANANGGSAGMVMTSAGELGDFAVRIDVDASGNVGMRFEKDQSANLQAVMPVPGLTLDTWHTIRFVRKGGSGIAYADGVKVLGIDTGPSDIYDAATVLMFGANTAGMVAHYRNISVTTTTDVPVASGSSSSGSSGEQHDFTSAGQWTINHSIGRIPSVTVYDAAGNLLLAEATATSTQVVITFANPTAGTAVLT